MSDIEHLLENVLVSFESGKDPNDELDRWPNDVMLNNVCATKEEIIQLADYVYYYYERKE